MDENEKAYSDGYESEHSGYKLKDNPHKRFSEKWSQWRQGWLDHRSDDQYWVIREKIHKKWRYKK